MAFVFIDKDGKPGSGHTEGLPAHARRGAHHHRHLRYEALGPGDPATWSYQVIVQSSEGFPSDRDLLIRKVNEYEGQHRFGGGSDMDCDPHVLDLFAAPPAARKKKRSCSTRCWRTNALRTERKGSWP